MAKLYHEINESAGPVTQTNYSRAMFLATLGYLRPSTEKQTLTGSGTIDLEKRTTWLQAASGAHAVNLPDGTAEHEEHWIFYTGTGGTFVVGPAVAGHLRNFTSLMFDENATSAHLIWVNGKWDFVGGTARPS